MSMRELAELLGRISRLFSEKVERSIGVLGEISSTLSEIRDILKQNRGRDEK